MIRLYCPDLNVFVNPTDHNVIVWYQQHRVDPTIATLQTCLLYEETRTLKGASKYWDEKTQEIKYAKKRQTKVSGRYQLFEIPWSGLYDRHNRPIFHGDILHEADERGPLVCEVGPGVIRFLRHDTGLTWDITPEVQILGMRRIGSAVLDPHLVGDKIRGLFVYPKPPES